MESEYTREKSAQNMGIVLEASGHFNAWTAIDNISKYIRLCDC
jgi:hypothetical protein